MRLSIIFKKIIEVNNIPWVGFNVKYSLEDDKIMLKFNSNLNGQQLLFPLFSLLFLLKYRIFVSEIK
ncbi:hypothetical protein BOQ64_17075 [Chryseobacterium sp. CH25]|nr:hypothetical protein BOQ64_17075 [Chryseobacterium sp. CH25]RXM62787.1 hypothetical protein BOQ60_20360 [Chryseobacterium sp. CH1]